MVQGVFDHRPCLEVTVMFGGDYLRHEAEVRTLLEDLGLHKPLHMWFDRRATSWAGLKEADLEDDWTGRDIWSSPPPVALSNVP